MTLVYFERIITECRNLAANISCVKTGFSQWLAWKRRRRSNRVLFTGSITIAVLVTGIFMWALLNPAPGNFERYLALTWAWGMCALGLILGMAEYKTSPLRKARERGHLYILLYLGALLIITRALNMALYQG